MNATVARLRDELVAEAQTVGKSLEQHAAERLQHMYSIAGHTILIVAAVSLVLGAYIGWKVL